MVSIKDSSSEKLQMEKVIIIGRQRKAVHDQQAIIQRGFETQKKLFSQLCWQEAHSAEDQGRGPSRQDDGHPNFKQADALAVRESHSPQLPS